MTKLKPLVTFDYDDTLSWPDVEEFVKEVKEKYDVNVGIFTSRFHYLQTLFIKSNQHDLLNCAKRLDIPFYNIIWAGYRYKADYLKPMITFIDFSKWLFHLDDNRDEQFRFRDIGLPCILYNPNYPNWKEDCLKILEPYDITTKSDSTNSSDTE